MRPTRAPPGSSRAPTGSSRAPIGDPRGRRAGGRAALAASLLGLSLAACGASAPSLVVGSKNFSEQDLLGEIVATWVERTLGVRVERRLHLGGTFICHRAIRTGEIDLYVEYTGTALAAILEREPLSDPDSTFRVVRRAYDRFGLRWLEPLGFENTFAILVRRATADSLGLATISDAAPHAAGWTAGFGYEFMERADGFDGLARAYGLRLASAPLEMDLGLIYRALAEGRIDLTAGNSTDGRIEALDLVALEDDRRYFPPYEAAIVAREEALERHPGLRETLAELSGRIDTDEMRRLNRAVEVEGRDFREVAGEWVARELATGAAPAP